jgi:primosomal protein N' (replication factor Y)
MQYYEVFVASPSYLKGEPLTYASDHLLAEGAIVSVPVRNTLVPGFVVRKVRKPKFACKPVQSVLIEQPLPLPSRQLFEWLQAYYPTGSGPLTQQFLPGSLLTKRELKLPELPTLHKPKTELLPALTEQQQQIITIIETAPKKHFLLHGDTGTGKTRVYVERSLQSIARGRSAIILTPEISLTPQLAQTFQDVFGERVIITHSNLTSAARRSIWLRIIMSTEPLVLVGPRSALFAPFTDVGLIIVDEAHEQAYKQEQAPRYLATRVASTLAALHKAEFIMGSATPLVADYYVAEAKGLPILRMDKAAVSSSHTVKSEVIDLRNRALFSRNPILSDTLLEAVTRTLSKHEQALIYLNRRGTARLVLCQNCGWQALCPHCDLPLTYHGDTHTMRCHTCGWHGSVPTVCPECQHTDLLFRSVGTKAITESLMHLFPEARIRRFDTDLGAADKFEKHFESVRKGEVDILVGTQMLAKGLDLPKLGLVGVVAADSSLHFPDYTAAERTYQLLYQVLGRVGRGHRSAQIIVQTYQPGNAILRAALGRDWDTFYTDEIRERQAFTFPPFCYLLKLSCARKSRASAEKAATQLADKLTGSGQKIEVNGPAPSFYEHRNDEYVWQLVIKAKNRQTLLDLLPVLPANWTYDLDPVNLL